MIYALTFLCKKRTNCLNPVLPGAKSFFNFSDDVIFIYSSLEKDNKKLKHKCALYKNFQSSNLFSNSMIHSFDVFVIYRNILINECNQFRIEKGRHHENTTPLTVFHDVKGYHHFRI